MLHIFTQGEVTNVGITLLGFPCLQVSQPTRIQRKCDSQGDVLVFYNKADQQAFMTLWFFFNNSETTLFWAT